MWPEPGAHAWWRDALVDAYSDVLELVGLSAAQLMQAAVHQAVREQGWNLPAVSCPALKYRASPKPTTDAHMGCTPHTLQTPKPIQLQAMPNSTYPKLLRSPLLIYKLAASFQPRHTPATRGEWSGPSAPSYLSRTYHLTHSEGSALSLWIGACNSLWMAKQ